MTSWAVMESIEKWLWGYYARQHQALSQAKVRRQAILEEYHAGRATAESWRQAGYTEDHQALVMADVRRLGRVVRIIVGKRLPRESQVLRCFWRHSHDLYRLADARIHWKHAGLFAKTENRPSWNTLRGIGEGPGAPTLSPRTQLAARLIDEAAMEAAQGRHDLQVQTVLVISTLRVLGLGWRY